MQSRIMKMFCCAVTMAAAMMTVVPLNGEDAATTSVPGRMTVTASVASEKRMPEISQQDVLVTQGKERLKVTEWTPAQGDHAGLDLFILMEMPPPPVWGCTSTTLRHSSTLSRLRLQSESDTCAMPRFRSCRISPPTTPRLLKPCACPWVRCLRESVPVGHRSDETLACESEPA